MSTLHHEDMLLQIFDEVQEAFPYLDEEKQIEIANNRFQELCQWISETEYIQKTLFALLLGKLWTCIKPSHYCWRWRRNNRWSIIIPRWWFGGSLNVWIWRIRRNPKMLRRSNRPTRKHIIWSWSYEWPLLSTFLQLRLWIDRHFSDM